jgi:hypothetical protein
MYTCMHEYKRRVHLQRARERRMHSAPVLQVLQVLQVCAVCLVRAAKRGVRR